MNHISQGQKSPLVTKRVKVQSHEAYIWFLLLNQSNDEDVSPEFRMKNNLFSI